jgi:hypothetical protein
LTSAGFRKAAERKLTLLDNASDLKDLLSPPGNRLEMLDLEAIRGTFELFTSVAILTETARVLQTKFDWSEDKVREAIQDISQTVTVLRPLPTLFEVSTISGEDHSDTTSTSRV